VFKLKEVAMAKSKVAEKAKPVAVDTGEVVRAFLGKTTQTREWQVGLQIKSEGNGVILSTIGFEDKPMSKGDLTFQEMAVKRLSTVLNCKATAETVVKHLDELVGEEVSIELFEVEKDDRTFRNWRTHFKNEGSGGIVESSISEFLKSR
jgi:hypothetical protein